MRLFLRRPTAPALGSPVPGPFSSGSSAPGVPRSGGIGAPPPPRGSNVANVTLLTLLWLAVAGGGLYVTTVVQPRELAAIEASERAVVLRREEAGALTLQQQDAEGRVMESGLRWATRYKVVPDSLRAHDVVAYLNSLTRSGFKNVDVRVEQTETTPDVSRHVLAVSGRASYGALHRFVWDLENNRTFYRIRTLTIEHMDLSDTDSEGRPTYEAVVSFTLTVEALFGGIDGLSAPPPGAIFTDAALAPQVVGNRPPAVPASVLPMRTFARNPFYPLVLDAIPPNTYGLLEIESAELIAIADGRAIFRDGTGYHTLGPGSAVYLGYVSRIDAANGRVVAHLNKGGILDQVVRRIDEVKTPDAPGAGTGEATYRPLNPDGTRAAAAPGTAPER